MKRTEQPIASPRMEETVQPPEQMDKDEASSTGSPERIEAPVSEDLDIEKPFYGFDEISRRRRSTRTSKPMEKMKQFKGIHETLIGESWKEITASQKVPKCYQEAMVSEDAEMCKTAIREEYSSLIPLSTETKVMSRSKRFLGQSLSQVSVDGS